MIAVMVLMQNPQKTVHDILMHEPRIELHKHKGYGTARHIALIKQYGYSEIHRKSYKIKALEKSLFN